jgi:hypothetical protein
VDDDKAITRTGPYTPKGRAAAGLNNLKHGLHSTALVIPGREDPEDWARFSTEAYSSLDPVGVIEAALAHRIVEMFWRLRRVARAEHQMVIAQYERSLQMEHRRSQSRSHVQGEPKGSSYESALDSGPDGANLRVLPSDRELQQIIRYEAHLSRQLYQALHELEAMQAKRNGSAAPLARIQVHGLPEE